ncbi:MAG: Maf family protein [Gemmatimonadaceae bacterium]|nr:Maf family protein [Gemmatimonadaceae bacterium]
MLASASPRRADLLRQLRIPFEQVVSPVEEPEPDGGDPKAFVIRSATAKARAVAALLAPTRGTPGDRGSSTLVIGADTVVWCEDRVLGKPGSPEEAALTLRWLAGRQHTVCTGVAVLGPAPDRVATACETSRVTLSAMSEAAVISYVATGEPLDKAGSYAIQGLGARFVECVEGCYYNVVGLPLARLCSLLRSAGYDTDSIQDSG